jgi:hypothetical protein
MFMGLNPVEIDEISQHIKFLGAILRKDFKLLVPCLKIFRLVKETKNLKNYYYAENHSIMTT